MPLYKIEIFILALLHVGQLYAKEEESLKPIQSFSVTDGLAHNGVTSIIEDSRGYIWIGTYDGLTLYDGYELKVIKNTPYKRLFLSNRIRTISEDNNGNLWIGTDDGVSLYNTVTKKFRDIYSNKQLRKGIKGPIIRKIIVSKNSGRTICLTEEEGILIFNDAYILEKQYYPSSHQASFPIQFFDGIELDDSNYLFSTSIGLFLFNLEKQQFNNVLKQKVTGSSAIVKIDDQHVISTLSSGLMVFRLEHDQDGYKIIPSQKRLTSYHFSSISIDPLGNLWLGIFRKGVIKVDNLSALMQGNSLKLSYFEPQNFVPSTSCITTSNRTGCWVGTFTNGIYRFDLKPTPFHLPSSNNLSRHKLISSKISQLIPYDSNRVFVGSQQIGLDFFNTQTHSFEAPPSQIDIDNPVTIRHWLSTLKNTPQTSQLENQKKLNLGIKNKLTKFQLQTTRKVIEEQSGNFWVIFSDDAARIWFNSHHHNPQVEMLNDHPFFKKEPISLCRVIYEDPTYPYIWIGTDASGLFRISKSDTIPLIRAQIDQYIHNEHDKTSVPSNFVSSIVRLPNNELWIGTEGGGICKVINSNTTPQFISYSEHDGLSNNVVKSIEYDNLNNLWISTNIGLNKFNTQTHKFRSFKKQNGLPFEAFFYSSTKLKNGILLFSGLNGFCYFNPQEVEDQEQLPILRFTDFKIFNTIINPKDTIDKRVLLTHSLSNTDRIVLNHDENVFSLNLTSLHYSTPKNHHLRYKLLPINKEWIEVPSNQQAVSYDGLPPGEYEFRAMASNSLNEWTEPKSLKIIIKPPFWATAPAFILYISLLGLIIYGIIAYYLRINKLRHNLQIEHLEKERVKEVNAEKLQFFSNISHEIKTPLTLITGPVNQITEKYKGNTDLSNHLHFIQRQIKKILQLVDQVHDFQRADANKLRLNPEIFCFDDFIKELLHDFKFWADNDHKTLNIHPDVRNIYVSADRDKLEKIINNILNNAFKFTKPKDSISVNYSREANDLTIVIKDTGKGILEEDLPHIFERFYRSKNGPANVIKGSGIGLAFAKRLVELHHGSISAMSHENKGTTMTIKLPVVCESSPEITRLKGEKVTAQEKTQEVPIRELQKRVNPSNIEVEGSFSDTLVFIAEDNSDLRQYLKETLSHFFKAKAFADGHELSKALENEWPDIVVSDVLMPELNGFDLCKQIKTDLKTSHIPVILLTACSSQDDRLKGLKYGADAYIQKPFDIQHLVTRIEGLLQNRKQLRERFQIDLPLKIKKNDNSEKDLLFLKKLYQLMEENLNNSDLDMQQLAKQLFLNRTLFFHKVKVLTNQTPFELLKSYRLKRASELLTQQQRSVNEVFMMTGFKSRSNFCKLFKEKYDLPPGKYASESMKSKK